MAFTDSYTRSDQNLEADANWTRVDGVAGAAKVVSNRLDIIDGSSSSAYYCPDQGTTDHYVQYTTAQNTADASAFHCCRLRDSQNFIGIRSIKIGGTTFEVGVYTRLAGSLTNQSSNSTAFSIGDVFRLECNGSTWVGKKNGTQFATGTIPSHLLSGQTNAGRVGICARGGPTTFWADDFEAGPLTTGRTGTLAVTIDAVTQSAAGTVKISGTLASTIAAVTQSANGTVKIAGTLAVTIAAVTQAASGSLGGITGSLAATIAAVTQAATGTLKISSTLAATIDPVTLAAIGAGNRSATLAVTISPVTQVAIGVGAGTFTDDFNRADATIDASPTSSSGKLWSSNVTSGHGAIRSNQFANLTSDIFGTEYFYDLGTAEQQVSFKILDVTANSFITMRSSGGADGGTYVGIRVSGHDLQLFRHNGSGTYTQFYNVDHTLASGDVLEVTTTGSTIEVKKIGISLTGIVAIGGSFTGTKAGIHCRQSVQNPLLDDFSVAPYFALVATTGTLDVTIGPVTQVATALSNAIIATLNVTIGPVTQTALGAAPGVTFVPVTGAEAAISQGNVTVFTIFSTVPVTGAAVTVSAGSVTIVAPSAFFDNFDRANANLEDSRTATSGAQWSWDGFAVGAGRISSNALASNSTGGGSAYTYDIGNKDQTVSWTVRSTAPNSFVCVRLDSDQTKYVGVRVSGTNFQIYRNNFGFTQVYNVDHGIIAGDTLRVTVTGVDTLRLYKNGVMVLNTTYGSTAFAGTRVGVHLRQAVQDPFIDDFSAERYLGDVDTLVDVTCPATLTLGQGAITIPNPGTRLVSVTGNGLTVSQGSIAVSLGTTGIFSDTFNRADANLEDSTLSSSGGTWTHDGAVPGAMRIFNTLLDCQNASTAAPSAYKTPDIANADHFVEYRLPSMSVLTGPFAACRMADKHNYVGVRGGAETSFNWGFLQVYRVTGNVLTNLFNGGDGTVQSNDIIKLGVLGTNFYVFRNGSLLSSGAIGDGSLTSTGTGIVARGSTGILFDDFRMGVFNPTFLTGQSMTVSGGNVTVIVTYTVNQGVTGFELTMSAGDVLVSTNETAVVPVTMDNTLVVSQGGAYAGIKVTINVATGVGDFMLASGGTVAAGGYTNAIVTGFGLTLSQGSLLRVDTQAKPAVSGELMLISQGSVTVRANTGVSVTNPALLTMSLTGVTVTSSARALVSGGELVVSTGASGSTVGFTLHYKVNVTSQQLTINPGAVFISGIPVVYSDLGEGLMFAMDNWMGNR